MAEVDLSEQPIAIGFDWGVELTFPDDFLVDGDTVRADLRRFPSDAIVTTFYSARDGQAVSLTLTAAQTSVFNVWTYCADLLLVNGAIETPLNLRLSIPARILTTRPA